MAGFFDVMRQEPVRRGEQFPLFNRINVETSRYCNRDCPFCPISRGTREEKVLMPTWMVEKVAAELRELRYDGVLQVFFLNEPLLDPRISDIVRLFATEVPRASIYVSTNADPLGRDAAKAAERLWSLFCAGLTVVNLNVYDHDEEGREQAERFERILELLGPRGVRRTGHKYRRHNPRAPGFVAITDMRPERLTASITDSFHGRSSGEKDAASRDPRATGYCMRTQRHMIVEHDGRVPICCAIDPTDLSDRVPRVGSVADRTMRDIWDDDVFRKYRWFTQQGRRELPACRGCTHRMAYAHVVRRVAPADAAEEAAWEAEAAAASVRGRPRRVPLTMYPRYQEERSQGDLHGVAQTEEAQPGGGGR